MNLNTAIILFFIVFMVVQNQQKECNCGNAPNEYGYVGSIDSSSRIINHAVDRTGRTGPVFMNTSPESWGNPPRMGYNMNSALTVGGVGTGFNSVRGINVSK